MTLTGQSIAKSSVPPPLPKYRTDHHRVKNTATVSSDEEEDLGQLQVIEQKLLAHDPTFTKQHTHASIISRRSALLTAFKPAYEEGDVEGAALPHFDRIVSILLLR